MLKVIFFLSFEDKQNSFKLLLTRLPAKGEISTITTTSGKIFKMEIVDVAPHYGNGGEKYHVLVRNPLHKQELREFVAGWENMKANHQSF